MTPEELLDEYKRMHLTGTQFLGWTILDYVRVLKKLVVKTGSTTILDYGSGQGHAWPILERELGVTATKYDPAYEPYSAKPAGTYHGVVCIDVLEHVPEDLVEATVAELFAYAERFVLVTTCPRPAKKKFPDGTNMHVTQRSAKWWLPRFKAANTKPVDLIYRETL